MITLDLVLNIPQKLQITKDGQGKYHTGIFYSPVFHIQLQRELDRFAGFRINLPLEVEGQIHHETFAAAGDLKPHSQYTVSQGVESYYAAYDTIVFQQDFKHQPTGRSSYVSRFLEAKAENQYERDSRLSYLSDRPQLWLILTGTYRYNWTYHCLQGLTPKRLYAQLITSDVHLNAGLHNWQKNPNHLGRLPPGHQLNVYESDVLLW